MLTYVSLLNFTDQGIGTVGETVQRADGAAELARDKYGCSLRTYWTMGAYEVVYILEAPDDESATASSWTSAPGVSSGRLRFAPMIAKRCRGSSKDSPETTSAGPELLVAPSLLLSWSHSPGCVKETSLPRETGS
jgi:uncharacterized protein with GYD domain